MDAHVTREDITYEQVREWKDSGTPYLSVAAALIEQIWAGQLRGEVPATDDLVKEHGCIQGDVLTAKILLAQLGFLATDRAGFHLPEDVTREAGPGDVTWTVVAGQPGSEGGDR